MEVFMRSTHISPHTPSSLITLTTLTGVTLLTSLLITLNPTNATPHAPSPPQLKRCGPVEPPPAPPKRKRKKTKWELQAEQLEEVRALRRAKRRAKRFKALEERYQKANTAKKGPLLKEMIKVELSRAASFLTGALTQRQEMPLRIAALEAMREVNNKDLRALALKSSLSPYVLERKALAELLTFWGCDIGARGLRELAADKSVTVRRAAIQGLGALSEALELLEGYALEGPDEGTAEAAAHAWLNHSRAHNNPTERREIAFKLLSSTHAEAREVGVTHLTAQGEAVCAPLTHATLAQRGHSEALDSLNKALWSVCAPTFMSETMTATAPERAFALSSLARWGVQSAEVSRLIRAHLAHIDPRVRAAALQAADRCEEGEAREALLLNALSDAEVEVRCTSLLALVPPSASHNPQKSTQAEPLKRSPEVEEKVTSLIKEAIERNLPEPRRDAPSQAWLTCTLSAMRHLGSDALDLEAVKAYRSWRRSIAYDAERLKLVEAVSTSPGAGRLEVLMEAMLDTNPEVKAAANRALRR